MQTPLPSGLWPRVKKCLVSTYWTIGYVCTILVVIGVAWILLGGLVLPLLDDVFLQAYHREQTRGVACLSNEHQIGLALMQYAQDYENVMPPAAIWMDATMPRYIRDDHALRCPSIAVSSRDSYGYAFNSNLGGKNAATTPELRTTLMVYDSTNLRWNAHASVSSLPSPGRHLGANNIAYADGHMDRVAGP